MNRNSADDLDEDAEEHEALSRTSRRPSKLVAAALAVLLLALGFALWRLDTQGKQIKALTIAGKALQIRAPSSVQTYRLKPSNGVPQTPSLSLGWPNPPQLLELRIDVSDSKFNTFQLTIDKKNEARVAQIRRLARDSNKELQLNLNSSAFGPGEYQLKLEGYTWRGELQEEGWLLLKLE